MARQDICELETLFFKEHIWIISSHLLCKTFTTLHYQQVLCPYSKCYSSVSFFIEPIGPAYYQRWTRIIFPFIWILIMNFYVLKKITIKYTNFQTLQGQEKIFRNQNLCIPVIQHFQRQPDPKNNRRERITNLRTNVLCILYHLVLGTESFNLPESSAPGWPSGSPIECQGVVAPSPAARAPSECQGGESPIARQHERFACLPPPKTGAPPLGPQT
jgi:hypothetical protein